ncbi:restriction endonuclease subunit S [Vibrio sp.]|uniref:restriction endonuclease subunit S n=1 Tax=Vibrio sp. TaxID=678 RepID=UPI0037AEE167
MSFEMTTLGEYIKVQGGYAYKSKDFIESSDNKVLKIKNVRFGTIDYSEPAYVSNEIAEATNNWKVKEGDVLISMTGSGPNAPQSLVGRVARVWKNEPDAWINQRVGRVCLLDEAPVHLDFIFYWLSLPQSQDYLVSNSSGSANQANISGKIIESLPCPKVDYQISKQIADLARKFDEKIILNSQTNQTLEEMAQAIFKSWFVDFDPVKAKMNGEQPEGMDAATASLFPEKLVESELGLIPEGWEVKPFSKWVKITKGKNITKKTIVEGDVPVVAGGLKPAYFHNAHNVNGPAITISASGANAGYVNLYFENIWASDCSYISQPATPMFFLQYVALRYNQKKIFDMQTGAAQPHIYPRDFERLMIAVPNEELCRKLEDVFASFFGTVANNKQQNIELAALRDTLLPKLLSGEIELETK